MPDETSRKKITIDTSFFGVPAQARHARVTLLPSGISVMLENGESIFEAAKRAGVEIPSECGGKGTCGRCRVRFPLPVREPTFVERQHIDRADLALGVRLACRSRPDEDVEITVPRAPRSGRR